jgi:hypothetical protein
MLLINVQLKGNDSASVTKAEVLVDYLGNVMIKYNDVYYLISLDEKMICLTPLKNPNIFRTILQDNLHMKSRISGGKIISNIDTLRGKVMDVMGKTDEDELMSMDFNTFDNNFTERHYYHISNNKDDDDSEDEENDDYCFNGLIDPNQNEDPLNTGICFADLMMNREGTFDTIIMSGGINSKSVVSSIEKASNYCSHRLTIFTDGVFKINNVGSSVGYCKLIAESESLQVVMCDGTN